MKRIVLVTEDPISERLARGTTLPETGTPPGASSEPNLLTTDARADGTDGAWLDFYGIVRSSEPDGARIEAIDYEAHVRMAEHQIHRILDRLAGKYPLSAVVVIHRFGEVPVGEPSLLVRILAPHRGEALEACAEFIDDLKRDVPIWKHPR